jgi:hypothetical protein
VKTAAAAATSPDRVSAGAGVGVHGWGEMVVVGAGAGVGPLMIFLDNTAPHVHFFMNYRARVSASRARVHEPMQTNKRDGDVPVLSPQVFAKDARAPSRSAR